jgi:tRNA(Ile)-lysidine synthase
VAQRLPELVLRAVAAFGMWRGGDPVVCGVSGGPDSTALLAAICALPPAWRPRVVVAHLDHGMRDGSGAEAGAVAALADSLGLPAVLGRADVPAHARRSGRSPEDTARQARYRFLARVAAGAGARVVAVGHHGDDQVETVLLNLARGAGARGLSGMRPRRVLGVAGFTGELVRPLWFAGRAEILAFLEAEELPFLEDASNADPARPRNAVRHSVIPAMQAAVGPGVRAALLRSAQNLAEEAEALDAWAEEAAATRVVGPHLLWGDGWTRLPAAIRHRVVERWWEAETGCPPLGRRQVQALLEGRTGTFHLPHGWLADVGPHGAVLLPADPGEVPTRTLPVPGSVTLPSIGLLTADWVGWPSEGLPADADACAVGDADAVVAPLTVRAPLPGERVRPLGGAGPRPVRELLREAGVPPSRRRWPWVVSDGRGRVLWVVGARAACEFRVSGATRRALVVALRSVGPSSLS